MKAVYIEQQGGKPVFRDDVPKPVPAKGEALIKVLKAGICGTDLEIAKGYMGFTGIPGHEFVGIVEDADDKGLIGSRVVGEINCGCGVCAECLHSGPNHCASRTVLGIQGRNGAFAEYLVLPEKNLHNLSDEISDEEGVFVEPLSAAYRIVEQVVLRSNSVLVMGDGKLGLLVAEIASVVKGNVTICGRHPENLALLDKLDVAALLESELKEDRLYDVVVDVTGNPDSINTALAHTKPRGQLVLKTTVEKPALLDLNRVVINEISVIGSRCGPFEQGLSLLEIGAVDVRKYIRARFPLEKGAEAFEEAAKPGALKVLIG